MEKELISELKALINKHQSQKWLIYFKVFDYLKVLTSDERWDKDDLDDIIDNVCQLYELSRNSLFEKFYHDESLAAELSLKFIRLFQNEIDFDKLLKLRRDLPLEFFEKHKDDFDPRVFKVYLPRHYTLPLEFILKHENDLSWDELLVHQPHIPKQLAEKHRINAGKTGFSLYAARPENTDLLEKYPEYIDWEMVCIMQSKLNTPLEVFDKFQPRIPLKNFKWLSYDKKLTPDFIDKHAYRLDWKGLIETQPENLTELLLIKYKFLIDNETFSKVLPSKRLLSVDFIDRFADELDWAKIVQHQTNLPEWLIKKHKSRMNYETFSTLLPRHQKLSLEFIERFANELNWFEIVTHQSVLDADLFERYFSQILRDYQNFKKNHEKQDEKNDDFLVSSLTKFFEKIGQYHLKDMVRYLKFFDPKDVVRFVKSDSIHSYTDENFEWFDEKTKELLLKSVNLRVKFLEKYADKLDWNAIVEHQKNLPAWILEKHLDKIDRQHLAQNAHRHNISEHFMETHLKDQKWDYLVISLPNFSPEFIIRNMDKFTTKHCFSHLASFHYLSLEFIDKYAQYLDWTRIIQHQKHVTEELIKKHRDLLNYYTFYYLLPQEKQLTPEFIDQYADELSWQQIIRYQSNLPEWLLRKHKDKIDYYCLKVLLPQKKNISASLIEELIDRKEVP